MQDAIASGTPFFPSPVSESPRSHALSADGNGGDLGAACEPQAASYLGLDAWRCRWGEEESEDTELDGQGQGHHLSSLRTGWSQSPGFGEALWGQGLPANPGISWSAESTAACPEWLGGSAPHSHGGTQADVGLCAP